MVKQADKNGCLLIWSLCQACRCSRLISLTIRVWAVWEYANIKYHMDIAVCVAWLCTSLQKYNSEFNDDCHVSMHGSAVLVPSMFFHLYKGPFLSHHRGYQCIFKVVCSYMTPWVGSLVKLIWNGSFIPGLIYWKNNSFGNLLNLHIISLCSSHETLDA